MSTRLLIAAALAAAIPFLGLSAAQAGTAYNKNDPNGGYGGIARPVPRGLKRQPAVTYGKTKQHKNNVCVATARRNRGSGTLVPSTRSLVKAHYLAKACDRALNECNRYLRKRKAKGKNPIAKCVVVRRNKRIIAPLVVKSKKRSCVATARRNSGNGNKIPSTRRSKTAYKQGVACNRALNACRNVLHRRQSNGKNPYAKCVVVRRNGYKVIHYGNKVYSCVATAKRNGGNGNAIPSTRHSKDSKKQSVACNRALNACKNVLRRRQNNGRNPYAKCVVVRRNGHAVVRFNKGGNSRKYRCVATARRARGNGKAIPSTRNSKIASKQGVACTRALNGCNLVLLGRKANGKNKRAKCVVAERAVIN